MTEEQFQIESCIKAIEAKLGWGKGKNWTHQDFINLSELIMEETGESISYITLKRVWGKVTYNSLPNLNTLNTLAHFLEYDSWRAYQKAVREAKKTPLQQLSFFRQKSKVWLQAGAAVLFVLFILLVIPGAKDQPPLHPEDYRFSSKKVVSQGIPNSVVFDIEAGKSPYDTIEVQQSWDARLRTKISKDQKQHTSIYYYPGFFEAKLVVGGKVMQEHALHITSGGWYCAIQQDPVPVYLPVKDIQNNGRLEVTTEQVLEKNILLQPQPPLCRIGNIREFGDLKTDNFVFEATLQHTYREGSAACQRTLVYLLCEGEIIMIPLTAKGCVSTNNLYFIHHSVSGKEKDLSVFGVDFNEEIHLKVICVNGEGSIYLDGKKIYSVPEKVDPVSIKGIDFRFRGLGAVSDVKLGKPGGHWILHEDFEPR